ncbi:18689_t:CDS:2, partial [Racocetra persica]
RKPRLLLTRHYEYCCDESVKNIHDYFKKQKAFSWCIHDYVEYTIVNEPKLDFFQALNMFTSSLNTLNQNFSIPVSETVYLNAKTDAFQTRSQNLYYLWELQEHYELQELRELHRKLSDNRNLAEEVREEVARELSIIRDANSEVWTTTLEGYINTVIEENKEIKPRLKYQMRKNFLDYIVKKFSLIYINPSMSKKISE